jgi:hypothetical protein
MTAASIIAMLVEAVASDLPEIVTEVDAWIHSAGTEALQVAAARKAASAAIDAAEKLADK